MEHFVLKHSNGEAAGLIPILEDDYDTALQKAKKRALNKVNPLTDVIIYHRVRQGAYEDLRPVMKVEGKKL